MRNASRWVAGLAALLLACAAVAADPLPSWNEGASKAGIHRQARQSMGRSQGEELDRRQHEIRLEERIFAFEK